MAHFKKPQPSAMPEVASLDQSFVKADDIALNDFQTGLKVDENDQPVKYGSGALPFPEHDNDRVRPEAVLYYRRTNESYLRSELEHELDLVDIARLYLQGYTMAEIAGYVAEHRAYKFHVQHVMDDIKLIRQRWSDRYIEDYNQAKSTELARIDQLERAYWDEWERSKQDRESFESVKTQDEWESSKKSRKITVDGEPPNESKYTRTKITAKKEKMLGAVAYLNGVQWCINQRCKILGLDAPKTINVNWRQQALDSGVNPDEFMNELVDKYLQGASSDAEYDMVDVDNDS